jgi:hypothetical protein
MTKKRLEEVEVTAFSRLCKLLYAFSSGNDNLNLQQYNWDCQIKMIPGKKISYRKMS